MPNTGSHSECTAFEPSAPCCTWAACVSLPTHHLLSSDCRTPLLACSCYPIPFPLCISSLAHSPPPSTSTIPLGQGPPKHLFLLSPYERYFFTFPPKHFPSPCTTYLQRIFSIFCIDLAGPSCVSKSQSHSGE